MRKRRGVMLGSLMWTVGMSVMIIRHGAWTILLLLLLLRLRIRLWIRIRIRRGGSGLTVRVSVVIVLGEGDIIVCTMWMVGGRSRI